MFTKIIKYLIKVNDNEEIIEVCNPELYTPNPPYYQCDEIPFKKGHKAMYNPERGVYFEPVPPTEVQVPVHDTPVIPYEQKIVNRIRSVYSVDDELAIIRQRDSKPEEFQIYFDFVEQVKATIKAEMEETA